MRWWLERPTFRLKSRELAEATLTPQTYGAVLERLDAGSATVRELITEPKIAGLGLANLRQHLLVLVAQRTCHALPLQSEDERKRSTDAFNGAVDFCVLGVAGDRRWGRGQLALLAMREGIQDRADFIS